MEVTHMSIAFSVAWTWTSCSPFSELYFPYWKGFSEKHIYYQRPQTWTMIQSELPRVSSIAGNRAQGQYLQVCSGDKGKLRLTTGSLWGALVKLSFVHSSFSVTYSPHKAPTNWHGWKSVIRLLHLESVWCFLLKPPSLENHKDVIHSDPAGVSQIDRPVDELTIVFGGLQSYYCVNVLGH